MSAKKKSRADKPAPEFKEPESDGTPKARVTAIEMRIGDLSKTLSGAWSMPMTAVRKAIGEMEWLRKRRTSLRSYIKRLERERAAREAAAA